MRGRIREGEGEGGISGKRIVNEGQDVVDGVGLIALAPALSVRGRLLS